MQTSNADLSSLLRALWRRKWMIASLTLLVAGGVAVLSHFTPQQYRAKATVLVKLGREFINRPQFDGERATSMFRLNEMINTEITLLESQDLAGNVVARFGATELYPELLERAEEETLKPERMEALAIGMLRDALSITAVTDSSVIEIAFTHANAELSAAVVNGLVEEFERKHLQIFGTTEVRFLKQDAEQLGSQLRAAEGSLLSYRTEHGLWNPSEQEVQLIRRSSALSGRRSELQAGLQGTERARLIETARSQLLRAQFAEQELLASWRPESRAVTAATAAVKVAAKLLADLQQQTSTQVADQIAALDVEIGKAEDEMIKLASGRRKLRELERIEQRLTEQFEAASRRLASAKDAERLDKEGAISVSVVDGARPPLKPMGLSAPKRVVVGAIAGFLFAIAMALALYRLSLVPRAPTAATTGRRRTRQPRRRPAPASSSSTDSQRTQA